MDYDICKDFSSIFLISVFICGGISCYIRYFTQGLRRDVKINNYEDEKRNNSKNTEQVNGTTVSRAGRSIIQAMADAKKNCVVFFGSQTGNAEDYASRLAREGASRFSLRTMVANLEDYDFGDLNSFPENHVMLLVLATYGEGEPTDNAEAFYTYITNRADDEDTLFSLSGLKYAAFGLGNSSYEQYNAVVRRIDEALQELQAYSLCPAGEGDDGQGTIEEDFLAWKETMWSAITRVFGVEERAVSYEPTYDIKIHSEFTPQSPSVYLGELETNPMNGDSVSYTAINPYISTVIETRELFHMKDRNCIHMELDIIHPDLSYETGDHVAIWPMNSSVEVDRFLAITNLAEKRDQVISLRPVDGTSRLLFPTPTTYDSIARHYLEICGPVSRQFVSLLVPFSPDETSSAEMNKLANDKDYFSETISKKFINIAQLLEMVGNGKTWDKVPFSAFIEGLHRLQPRFYSISSSSTAQPKRIAIAAVVESHQFADRVSPWKGVNTSYLLAIHRAKSLGRSLCTHSIQGPRGKYSGFRVPIHIRRSNFRLPADPTRPLIMVGPGTGVAPFRAFLRERAAQQGAGMQVGRMILFYGCRTREEDFIYNDEWEGYKKVFDDKFDLITAFSREGPNKVYVQDRLLEHTQTVNEILEHSGHFYVCGDAANMARAVAAALCHILSQQRGISESEADHLIKRMRSSSLYQEDTW